MKISDIFIHDSEIISVIEDAQSDTIDFVINFPVDWDNDLFKKKILRFYDCLNYTIKEIPFSGRPSILNFKDYGEINYSIGEGRSKIDINRRKIEFITNAGARFLEYKKFDLLDL